MIYKWNRKFDHNKQIVFLEHMERVKKSYIAYLNSVLWTGGPQRERSLGR